MKKKNLLAVIISCVIILIGFILSLLTNYASSEVPDIVKKHPYFLWTSIFICILILFLFSNIHVITAKRILLNKKDQTTFKSQGEYMYDVFISYSYKDAEWVRGTLLNCLEERGFSVFIDFRDFSGGSFSIEQMQKGVVKSRHVIIVMTKNYMSSEWSKFENAMSQTSDPGATQRKTIPVLREDCEIPLRLQILHYRDLRSDDPQEWELLFRDLI